MAIPHLPIPGQSLTAEPKAAPYERPPQMVDPQEVLDWHLDRLSEEDKKEALADAAELGVDVVTLTQGLLRGAVADGRHSIDVSLIIAPVIHEFICGVLEANGIEFEEGFEDDSEAREKIEYAKTKKKALKLLKEHEDTGDITSPVDGKASEESDAPKKKGLMAPKKSDRMKRLEGEM